MSYDAYVLKKTCLIIYLSSKDVSYHIFVLKRLVLSYICPRNHLKMMPGKACSQAPQYGSSLRSLVLTKRESWSITVIGTLFLTLITALSLPLSFSHSLIPSVTLTLLFSLSITRSHFLSLSLTFSHSLSLSFTRSHFLSLTLTFYHSLSFSLTRSLFLSLSLTRSHFLSLTLSYSHSLSLSLTRSLFFSLALTFSHSLSLSLTRSHLYVFAFPSSLTLIRTVFFNLHVRIVTTYLIFSSDRKT